MRQRERKRLLVPLYRQLTELRYCAEKACIMTSWQYDGEVPVLLEMLSTHLDKAKKEWETYRAKLG